MSEVTPNLDALAAAIAIIKEAVACPNRGLPEDVFLLISSMTPLVNVDLLIKDSLGRTLLTWRHDRFYGPGWHIPGGIIRFKESAAQRIAAVAANELGARVSFSANPIAVHEITNPNRDVRGHFISLLYACRLESPLDERRRFVPETPLNGAWAWHDGTPENLIYQHNIYIRYISE